MKTRISNYNELKLGIRVNNLLVYINYIKFAKTSYHNSIIFSCVYVCHKN